MSLTIDYYFAPQSPWTYLGHARLAKMAAEAHAKLRVMPVDLGRRVFPVSGGLPLGERAPQRQAYRLVELRRFSELAQLPLNIHPQYFPVAGDDAARLIIAVDLQDGSAAAMAIASAVLAGVWVHELNIASEEVLVALLAQTGMPTARLAQSHSQQVNDTYAAYTQQAIDAGVFGAPSYVVGGEIFWGQDRLDFLARRLARA